jgi:hypothetical protein
MAPKAMGHRQVQAAMAILGDSPMPLKRVTRWKRRKGFSWLKISMGKSRYSKSEREWPPRRKSRGRPAAAASAKPESARKRLAPMCRHSSPERAQDHSEAMPWEKGGRIRG